MLKLKWLEGCAPKYMTELSSACDLLSREKVYIEPGEVGLIPTGVFIEQVMLGQLPVDYVPELQIRCRSSFPIKRGLMLANGVGTIDADYRDEIGVLLYNASKNIAIIKPHERIAQMTMGWVLRIPGVPVGGERTGGFGSTGGEG